MTDNTKSRRTAWAEGDDIQLTELWIADLPASEIGRQMLRTKNSVIGRAHRLKLPARSSPICKSVVKPRSHAQRKARRINDAARGRASDGKRQPALPVSAAPQAPVRIITVVDATPLSDGCKWPMWPHATRPALGEHRFCAAVRYDLRHVYCKGHAQRAFVRKGVAA